MRASRERQILIGVATFLMAALIRLALQPYLGNEYAYLQFYPAVFLSAWLGGLGGAITTTLLSALAAQYFLSAPQNSFFLVRFADAIAETVFVASGLAVSAFAEGRARAIARAEARELERDELERERQSLTERATRYRDSLDSLVGSVPAVVWEAWGQPDEKDQRINFVNRHVEPMLGYTVDEWLKTPNFWLTLVHPDDHERAADEALAIFRSGGAGTSRFRWIRKNGEVLWVEAKSTVIAGANGEPAGMRGVTVDVSDAIRMQAERNELLQRSERARLEAETANRIKDEFLMTLSHELRTPLNAVWGWARMLRTTALDESRRTRGLEVIERNAGAQLTLIEDLLDLSRIVVGKLRLNVQPIDPSAVIVTVVEAMRPAAGAKGVDLRVVADPAAGPIAGDSDRLQQVVWNLVSNAIKFTPRHGQVQLRLERAASHIEIIVSDTGQGISPELLPLIFERFRQGESGTSRNYAGLGLGLSIARSLIEAHGGTLEASSPGPDQGSTFRIVLPLLMASADAQAPDRTHPAAAPDAQMLRSIPGRRLNGVRVLVVEDDVDARDLLNTIIASAGGVARCESSAADGVRAVEEFAPDLILSDIELPGDDGYAMMRRIRGSEQGNGRRLPAVALTALVRPEDRMKALDAGFHAHLGKPVDPAELTAVIATLLGLGLT